jgi:hypothetical protein
MSMILQKMTHCGIGWWGESIENGGVVDSRYLAIMAGSSTSIQIAYILFFTKMQKRQTPKKRFTFLISKNTSLRFLAKRKKYCSDHNFAKIVKAEPNDPAF